MHDPVELLGMPKQKKFIQNFNLYSISKYFNHISRGTSEVDLAKSLESDRERSPLSLISYASQTSTKIFTIYPR